MDLKTQLEKQKYISQTQLNQKYLRLQLSGKYSYLKAEIYLYDKIHNGLNCDQLTASYLESYKPLKPLLLILKQILYLNKSSLNSLSLLLMLVSYFQSLQVSQNFKPEDFTTEQPMIAKYLIGFLYMYSYEMDNVQKFAIYPSKDVSIQQGYQIFQLFYYANQNGVQTKLKYFYTFQAINSTTYHFRPY